MKQNVAGIKMIIGLSYALIITTTGIFAYDHDTWEDSLTLIISDSRIMQLPVEPLENKIREGRAKKRPAVEIYSAVKNRQKLLLRIRDSRQGSGSQEYTRQLFDLERSDSPNVKTVKRNLDTTLVSKSHQPQVPSETVHRRERSSVDTSPEKKTAAPPNNDGRGNGKAKQLDRQMDKADAKAEKAMEKAAFRAEQRMESLQKRLQKRAMKRHGSDK